MCERPPSPFTPEREHVRMLQQQQRVGNRAGLALLDELALQRQRLAVRHDAQRARQLASVAAGASGGWLLQAAYARLAA